MRLEMNAQMAESVDALVSNTNNFTVVPVRPRLWVQTSQSSCEVFLFDAQPII